MPSTDKDVRPLVIVFSCLYLTINLYDPGEVYAHWNNAFKGRKICDVRMCIQQVSGWVRGVFRTQLLVDYRKSDKYSYSRGICLCRERQIREIVSDFQ